MEEITKYKLAMRDEIIRMKREIFNEVKRRVKGKRDEEIVRAINKVFYNYFK